VYHLSVLLNESIEQLNIAPDGIYVDATFGGGGHSAAILSKLGGKGRLYGLDQDADAEKNAQNAPFKDNASFRFVRSNFRHLKQQLRSEGVRPGTVSGILADLGVSSYQLDTAERGFSYRFEANLDMRMDTSEGKTAADVLNEYSAEKLQQVLGELGEVRNARTLAQAIVQRRAQLPFRTTGDLTEICLKNLIGDRPRYLSQVFQALRMEVNDELGALEIFLNAALEMLAPGGRLAVITFHSIEDRMVKNFLKTGHISGEVTKDFYGNIAKTFELVTKKPIEAGTQETKDNSRSRSAKLRVGRKIMDN
jgi:16S rRNA (cytosine1402-N4)-methyltransferase